MGERDCERVAGERQSEVVKSLLYASVRNEPECNVQPKADGRRGFGARL